MLALLALTGCFIFGGDDDTPTGDTAPAEPTLDLPEGVFLVEMETTTGPVTLEIHEDWAPIGAARFRALVEAGFYDDAKFFRVLPNFVVQWGIAADPAVTAQWLDPIQDDPVVESNTRRTITFAQTGQPNSRTTQVFVNYEDNTNLDGQGFAPFGRVIDGMPNLRSLNDEYGETPSMNQGSIRDQGNAYLDANFPNLDGIISATVRE
ncbi:MAG: peptidylprolyl isomerase [Myxococcota bacterium]